LLLRLYDDDDGEVCVGNRIVPGMKGKDLEISLKEIGIFPDG